jgi:hypothetical protein
MLRLLLLFPARVDRDFHSPLTALRLLPVDHRR